MRTLTGFVLASVVVLLASPNSHAADVQIPDANLRKVLLEILHRKQIKDDKITVERLQTIYFLHADGKDIADLSGLEHCRNLAEVRLAKNRIVNVEPLAACTRIQSLDLAQNAIKDIRSLGKLKKLQYLKIDDNRIESIAPVKHLKALASLYFDRNRVSSLKPVSGLPKLQAIYAAENRLTDITPLKDVKWLASLDVSSNKISDIRPLEKLTELRWTFLQENKIEEIGPLVEMAKKDAAGDQRFAPFWRLYLGKNPLNEQARSQHSDELKKLGVRLDLKYLRKKKKRVTPTP